jgi:hypothetical protein
VNTWFLQWLVSHPTCTATSRDGEDILKQLKPEGTLYLGEALDAISGLLDRDGEASYAVGDKVAVWKKDTVGLYKLNIVYP